MKNVLLIVITIVSILLIAVTADAQTEAMVSPAFLKVINATPPVANYFEEDSPAEKLGVGILNAVTAWTDIPAGVVEVSQDESVVAGSTLGLGEGIASGVARTVSGVYDMATCGFAPYNKPTIAPAYKVQRPEAEGLKVKLMQW